MASATSDESSDPRLTIDPELLNLIDDDALLVFRDGEPGFINQDGTWVSLALAPSTLPPPPPVVEGFGPTIPPADPSTEPANDLVPGTVTGVTLDGSEEATLAMILRVEGVVSAVAIGNGSFAVVAESQEAIDRIGLPAQPDAQLEYASDPYEPYQWTLDNTGDNLNRVMQSPPPQVPDADIDGREAAAGSKGRGVVVAVIDSGVDFDHPDLAGQSWVIQARSAATEAMTTATALSMTVTAGTLATTTTSVVMANGNHGTHVAESSPPRLATALVWPDWHRDQDHESERVRSRRY